MFRQPISTHRHPRPHRCNWRSLLLASWACKLYWRLVSDSGGTVVSILRQEFFYAVERTVAVLKITCLVFVPVASLLSHGCEKLTHHLLISPPNQLLSTWRSSYHAVSGRFLLSDLLQFSLSGWPSLLLWQASCVQSSRSPTPSPVSRAYQGQQSFVTSSPP